MSEKHLTHDMKDVPPEFTRALGIVLDSVLREHTHEERMFWAMQYAESEYQRAETGDKDLMDYRIAVDETAKSARKNSPYLNDE